MRFAPTNALVQSLFAMIGFGLLALILGRPGGVVLAVPFLVHLAWAFISRPTTARPPVATPRAVMVPEGEAVEVTVRIETPAPAGIVTVQWPQAASTYFDPPSGTILEALPPAGVQTTVEPERWGRYALGPAKVALTDASGAWQADGTSNPVSVTVRPSATKLEGGSGVSRPIGIVGAHRSRHRGDGSELSDVRDFRPGDRLRRINWRVTSRLGSLHVNSMLIERDTDVLIVADTIHDVMPADPHAATSLDLTVRAIAAISRHYVSFGDRVGLHDLGTRIGQIRPGTGPRQARVVLGALARARREGETWSSLQRVPPVAGGTLVFFCSPLLEQGAIDELVRLRRLGAEVIGVDTLPDGVGGFSDVDSFRAGSFLGEAWLLRRLDRDRVVARLRERGIPVVAWRGPTSLASILLNMEAARSAPRGRSGR